MKKHLSQYGNALLVSLSVMTITYTNSMASSLLVNIASDLGMDIALTGYLPTVTTLFMGLSLMAATAIVERFGLRRTMTAAMLLVTVGNLSVFWADSFWMLLVGRALVGIGMGILGDGFSTVAASWIGAKGRSVFVTAYTLGNSLASYLCYSTVIPLFHGFGDSWRACYLLLGILSAVLCAAWAIFDREPEREEKGGKCEKPVKKGGLLRAVRCKDVWILTIYHSLAIMCTNLINNYLPSYLQVVRGCTAGQASGWTGILTLTGMVGTVAGGVLSTALGKRRPVIISGTVLSLFSMIGLLMCQKTALILICIALFGFAVRYRIPPTTSTSTEMREDDPAFSSAAYALMFGVGSVLGVAVPPVLSMMTNRIGMDRAMLLFAALLAAAAVFSLFVKETGPNKEKIGGRRAQKLA